MRTFCVGLVVALLVAAGARAQVATGTPPFGSFSQGTFDTVDLANLNVHFAIPIFSKPGRGLPFHYAMDYESSIWVPTNVNSSISWQPVNSNWGWTAQSEALTGTVPVVATTGSCFFTDPNSGLRYKIKYPTTTYRGYKEPNGTFHSMPVITTDGDSQCDIPVPPSHTGSSGAPDGSGHTMSVDDSQGTANILVTTRSGWKIPNPGTSTATVIDTNGNELTTSVSGNQTTFTDTLGTTALTVNSPNAWVTTYSYAAPSGNQTKFYFNYTQAWVQTNFGCSGIAEYPATQVYLLTSVTLPDNTSYGFTYEQTPGKAAGIVTGRIASVILPTGGAISYAYTSGFNGITCADGSTATLTRTTPDGTWTYTHTESGTWNTSVSDPHGNSTNLSFNGIYETARQVYQYANGTSTLQYSTNTCYNNNCANQWSLPITQRGVGIQLGTNGPQTTTNTFYNSLGLPTEIDQYAYGAKAAGSLLRKTLITYNNSLTNNILDHPAKVVVQDGGGNLLGQTTYTYDEGQAPPSRGNLTTVSTYSSASAFLSKKYTYNNTGTVNVATDVNAATTTYGYGSGSCGSSFPDSTQLPLGLTSSATYNCTGGVLTSSTDANGNATHVNYNTDKFFWRPDSTQDAAGAVTSIAYTGATQVESVMNFNGGVSTVDLLTTLDSLGRVQYSQQKQAPGSSNYDSTQVTYDAVNALVKGTMPYAGTGGSPAPGGTPATTTNYDALGRTIQTTDGGGGTTSYQYTNNDVLVSTSGAQTFKKQLEYDSLGRLTSVCEVTAGTSAWPGGNCAQTNAQTGYLTTYTYDFDTTTGHPRMTVRQNAQGSSPQQRVYEYDLLGRLVSETNPESGTTSYVFDSLPSSCNGETWAIPGALISVGYANGNYICYQYDTLGRITAATGNSGSGGAPLCRRYYYDNSTGLLGTLPSGVSPQNPNGQLVEAESDTCAWPASRSSMITDEWFSYDADGRVTDVWEYTPKSQVYYHTAASYYPNGVPNTLSGLPGFSTVTYQLDGEGRWTSAKLGSVTLVSGTTYDATGHPLTVGVGSGTDRDAYLYDNVGRMKQYQFFVGSQNNLGVLNWNSNGSLGSLQITDGFNSANTQNCIFGYDDLFRLTGDSCGSVWSQTYSYDPYGNLTKSGSASFACPGCYDPATNQLQTTGATYDGAGNLTYDGSANHYTWDAYGKMATVNGTGVTYDAFGRAVVGPSGEVLYTPLGKVGVLQSATQLYNTYVPMPGGGAVSLGCCSSTNAWYLHRDWLGTSRVNSYVYASGSGQIANDRSFSPFGDAYQNSGCCNDPLLFAGMSSDLFATSGAASPIYDTPNRELANNASRWLSPDPAGMAAVDPASPQSWNRYAYVLNNPLRAIDPLGLECIWDDGSYDSATDPDTGSYDSCTDAGGTWVDPSYFATLGLADWSGDPNSDLASFADQIQNGTPDVTVIGTPCSMTGASAGNSYWTSWADPNNPVWQRMKMLGTGLGNLGIFGAKLTGAAAVEPGSGGLATPLAIYGAWSSSGNLAAGTLQVIGTFMPNPQPFNQGAQVAASMTTISGMTTLIKTGGNLNAASQAARWEGIFMSGFKLGATGNPPNLAQGYSGALTTVNSMGSGSSTGCN